MAVMGETGCERRSIVESVPWPALRELDLEKNMLVNHSSTYYV
jgi:hypothetical protein